MLEGTLRIELGVAGQMHLAILADDCASRSTRIDVLK